MVALFTWKGMIAPKIKETVGCDIALYYVTLAHLCFWFEVLYRICNQT